jgi:hypothetical protein
MNIVIPNIIIPSDDHIVIQNPSKNTSNILKDRVFPIAVDSEWASAVYEIWINNNKTNIISEDILHRIRQLDACYDWLIYNKDFSEKTISELKSEENIINEGIRIIKDVAIKSLDFNFFEDAIQLETQYFDRILLDTSSKTKYFKKYIENILNIGLLDA